jgi:hypothetical protein
VVDYVRMTKFDPTLSWRPDFQMKSFANSRKVRSKKKFAEIIEVRKLAVRATLRPNDKNILKNSRFERHFLPYP